MNNDLISRSALKEALAKNITIWTFNVSYDGILAEIIDNAPAVEPETKLVANVTFNKEQLEEIVEKAKADILAQIERPQGEWGKWIIAEVQCPNCFKYFEVDYYSAEELNKCPNCGADMRGEEK